MVAFKRVRGDAGMTLLEILVGAGILALLMWIAMMLLVTSTNNFAVEVTVTDLEQHARWVTERLTEDVRGAVASTRVITVVGGDTSITFRRNAGYAAGAVQLGNTITWQTELFGGELDDGLDNNANGLVDERQLVQIDNGARSLISPWIEEGGFQLTDLGANLQVTVLLRNFDASGTVHQERMSSTVQFRNP